MTQLGVIFYYQTKLPKAEIFFQTKESSSFDKLKEKAEASGFTTNQAQKISEPLEFVNMIESDFMKKFMSLVEGDKFFKTLLFLKEKMPEIRLAFRDAKVKNTESKHLRNTIHELTKDEKRVNKTFDQFIKKMKNWEEYTLFSLEEELDKLYINILEKSVGFSKNIYKQYVATIKNQYLTDVKERKELENSEAGYENSNKMSDKYFQDLAHKECAFVNRAIFEFDTDLSVLQSFVTHKYFFYNLRVSASISEEERSKSLINYNITT